jgi:hypothetical protein
LFEGDGHISTPKQIVLTLNGRDEKLLLYLRKRVGFGHVHKVKSSDAYSWIIASNPGLLHFLSLIDGHLKTTSKIAQIHSRGVPFKQVNPNLEKATLSWWFAGYTEAEGCFYLQVLPDRREVRLSLKFGVKERAVLEYIKDSFNGSKVFYRNNEAGHQSVSPLGAPLPCPRGIDTYYWGSCNFSSATTVVRYFDQHSLLGEKWNTYVKWRKVYSMIIKAEHRTEVGFNKIYKIKSQWVEDKVLSDEKSSA